MLLYGGFENKGLNGIGKVGIDCFLLEKWPVDEGGKENDGRLVSLLKEEVS